MTKHIKKDPYFAVISTAKQSNEISVSYRETMEDIRTWSMNEHHSIAIKAGKERWYDNFTVRICEVKREYAFGK